MTTDCRNTYIALIQCAYGNLGYQLSEALKIEDTELDCIERKAEIVDAYLDMMYCYSAFPAALTYFYTYQLNMYTPAQITAIFAGITALNIYDTDYDYSSQTLYVYSYNVSATNADILNILPVVVPPITPIYTNQITNQGILLNFWNCISYQDF